VAGQEHFEETLMAMYGARRADPATMRHVVARDRPDAIARPHREVSRATAQALREEGYALVYLDDVFFLMLPTRPDTTALLAREAYRAIDLLRLPLRDVTPAQADAVLQEAERGMAACPAHSLKALERKLYALRALHRHAEAWQTRLTLEALQGH
jgi:hypothetical protein